MTNDARPTELGTREPSRCATPTVKAQALAYLVFGRPHVEDAERFLTDFGLVVEHRTQSASYLRASSAPYCYRIERTADARFLGLGLRVSSYADLEALAALPGASAIAPSTHPGGGHIVVLTDPSGFRVEAIHGQETEDLAGTAPRPLNVGGASARINAPQRARVAPAAVRKLGHVVLEVADFQATCAWYTQHFGLLPSDVQVLPDGSPAVAFLRLNLGRTPADHHTLALAQGFMPAFGHAAFEVTDVDAVGMGQRVLRERGHVHAWGIGRHLLGSQIFDYWQDPFGHKHEHYCDGDLFDEHVPMGVHAVSREAMSQWGEVMPRSFTSPALTPTHLAALVRNVRRSPDLSLRKLLTLARIFG